MAAQEPIHPLIVRICHWLNAMAVLIMLTSGWTIYNASPLFDFSFLDDITLGGWLGGALLWHFSAMWLVASNGLIYLGYAIFSGRFARKFLPLGMGAIIRDLTSVFSGKLSHGDLTHYNAVQKAAYLGVILLLILIVASGLALWKPIQFGLLSVVFGGYDLTRYVHFWAMAGISLFLAIHLVMTLVVPRTLLAMARGWP